MKQSEKTQRAIIEHCEKYPLLQIADIFKFIYQSSFGCEHFAPDLKTAAEYICKEYAEQTAFADTLVDALDGDYSRVHLAYLGCGLSAETLAKLFCASAKQCGGGHVKLQSMLSAAGELVKKGKLGFCVKEFEDALCVWEKTGFSPVHHSEEFRKNYSPAYRVISNEYVRYLPLFAKIDTLLKEKNAVLAIDGRSAAGKTTLSAVLEEIYDCTVLHTDDFFLRPEQRTVQRLAQVGGNIDKERFSQEILPPLTKHAPIDYKRFDCSSMTLLPARKIFPKKLVVVEGAYSMHPEFEKYYDLSAVLDISPKLQKKRIEKRNSPELAQRFFGEWIPMENLYIRETGLFLRCDFLFTV